MSLLELSGVGRQYGALKAVDGVSFRVEENEVHGVIGPNGAGKTTLFNLISGFVLPTSGTIRFDGHDVTRWSAAKRANHGLKRTFQTSAVFGELTVGDNARLAVSDTGFLGIRPGAGRRERLAANELLEHWGLLGDADEIVDEMSYGRQRLVDVAMAFAGTPRLVALDEPTAGVDPAEISELERRIELARDQCACLLISHDLDFLFNVCQRITVLHHGQLIATGLAAEIRENAQVREAYLNTAQTAREEVAR